MPTVTQQTQMALKRYTKKTQEETVEVAKNVADSLAKKTLRFANRKIARLVDSKIQRIMERRKAINAWLPIFKFSEYTCTVEAKILKSTEYRDILQACQPYKVSAKRILDKVEASSLDELKIKVSLQDWDRICQFCRTELEQTKKANDSWDIAS